MFNYHELLSLQEAFNLAKEDELFDSELGIKINKLIEDSWSSGSVLPPMHAKFIIRMRQIDNKEFMARRTTLAEAYSPKTITLMVREGENWNERTLNVGEFQWRYL